MLEQAVGPVRRAGRGLLGLVAPPVCAGCGSWRVAEDPGISEAVDGVLCRPCQRHLPWLPHAQRCTLCQAELDAAGTGEPAQSARCAACRASPSPLAGCLASLAFRGEAERWIHRFKYPAPGLRGLDPRPLQVMQMLAGDLVARARGRTASVIPIPLHRRRLRERGFNPAALIAREVARRAALPLETGWLTRSRDTPTQTGLGRRERRRNVADAFVCHGPAAGSTAVPTRVWLVDDVVTTGATLEEAARCLQAAGVAEVLALCVARTPEPIGPGAGRDA